MTTTHEIDSNQREREINWFLNHNVIYIAFPRLRRSRVARLRVPRPAAIPHVGGSARRGRAGHGRRATYT